MLPERFKKLKNALIARQTDLTVVMENVHKPHNMAAILRSCEATGVYRAHIITPDGLYFNKPKSAAGVLRWVELEQHQQAQPLYEKLRQQGMRLIAAHPGEQATPFRDYDYTQPTAIIMGTERTGLTDYSLEAADELISIPMNGLVQSLNVSVSAALILYEAQRQREAAGLYQQASLEPEVFKQVLFEWSWPRIARYCQNKNIPYPEIDLDSGQIANPQAFAKLISSNN